MPQKTMNAISIDVEEWYHGELIGRHLQPEDRTPRLRKAIAPLLKKLSENGTLCTFFVLGDVAREHPDLIKQLHGEGHEIACHGMTHIPLWRLTPAEFRTELQEFRNIIAAIDPAIDITGFRAPTFSLDSRTAWALGVLHEEGFRYDSSIFPFANHVYGVPDALLVPYKPNPVNLKEHSDSSPLWEFPMAVADIHGVRIPVAGGFYMRALPYFVTAWALRRISQQRPFVLYCHPWECDKELPRCKLGFVNSLITYTGVNGALAKFGRLIDEFPCTRIDKVLANHWST